MVTPPRTFEVHEAQDSEIEGAIEALSDAFQTDPVMSMAVGGLNKLSTVRRLFRFQIETTYKPRGKIDVAVDEEGTVLGAALWLNPEGQKGNFLGDVKALPRYFRILGLALPRGVITELKLLRARPKFKHWYLYTIGVHSDARSRGVGGALLDFRRQQLGESPAYLEASTFRSAALYRRHGFFELGTFKGGKPAVGMWHPAPSSSIDAALENK